MIDDRDNKLTYKLLNVEAIDNFSDKVCNFVCVRDNLGAHQFKFNYTARNRNPNETINIIKERLRASLLFKIALKLSDLKLLI